MYAKINSPFLQVLFLLLLSVSGCVWGQEPDALPYFEVSSGSCEHYTNFPSKWVPPRNIEVWLPPGYSPKKKYPVLYMQDGQMLFDAGKTWNKQEWGVDEAIGELIKTKKIGPVIVVGIWNISENRHAEYFPQTPFSYLSERVQDSLVDQVQRNEETDLFNTYPYSDRYLKFITLELKPFIDRTYATLPQPEHTFIAGSSMGGLISLYAICQYPDVFGGAACLSTHWPGVFQLENNPIPMAFMTYLKTHLPEPKTHKVYFDRGTATLDSLYGQIQQKVDTIFLNYGYGKDNFQSLEFKEHDHSENSWQRRLAYPLIFLLRY